MTGRGRKFDAIWQCVEKDSDNVKCKYCSTSVSGKVERIRSHIAKCVEYKKSQQQPPAPPPSSKVSTSSTGAHTDTAVGASTSPTPSTSLTEPPKKMQRLMDFVVRTSNRDKEALDLFVAKYFYANGIPFNSADEQNFKRMIGALRPGYQPPNRKALSGDLLTTVYDKEVRKSLEEKLKTDRPITLMQDGWSSVENDAIIANSILIDGQAYLINTVDAGEATKTAEYCAEFASEAIEKIKQEYGKNVTAFVTGNENKKLRDILSEKYPDLLTYGCNSHYANLLDQAMSNKVVLAHINDIQKYFRNNHKAHGLLKKKEGLMPQLANETRWNSQEACLDTFMKNYNKYQEIADEEDLDKSIMNKLKNLELLKEAQYLHKQLKCVSVELDKLKSNSCTLADAVQCWKNLETAECLQQYKSAVNKRKNQAVEPFFYVAAMLDTHQPQRALQTEEKEIAENWILEKKPKYLPAILAFTIKDTEVFPKSLFTDGVLTLYQKRPCDWWLIMEKRCEPGKLPPGFCSWARGLLSVPPSTASLERLFSTMGHIWGPLRNRLGLERARQLAQLYVVLRRNNDDLEDD